MKRAAVFMFLACWAVSALSLPEGESKPAATVSPADEFSHQAIVTTKTTTTTTPKTTTTTTPKTTTTTTPKTTTTTTPKTTTTTTPTTTPKTTTTTTPKTTTTTTPTTTPKTTTTTTPKTTTTTTPKTTTTTTPTTTPTTPAPPKPTPSTKLTVGNYTIMADKSVICVMAQMALQIRLATPKENGTFIVQPNMTKAAGSCKGTNANLTLSFKEGFITFLFNKNMTEKTVYVEALSFSLNYPLSKAANMPYVANNKSMHLFPARIAHSYSCKVESVFMGNGLYLDVNQDQMQAFNLTKSNGFEKPDVCPADKPDYRVAIAVGVTLLVLIIIVVVAYLLGRRKRTDGYQSL